MKTFIATVLSVIAVGVLLIAYGLLAPRATAGAMDVIGRSDALAQPVANRLVLGADGAYHAYGPDATGAAFGGPYAAPATWNYPMAQQPVPSPRPVSYSSAPVRRAPARSVERPRRDWGKTAMVIGGSSAAGAGLGAIFGGKKGALIGAALGGGAATIYEVKH